MNQLTRTGTDKLFQVLGSAASPVACNGLLSSMPTSNPSTTQSSLPSWMPSSLPAIQSTTCVSRVERQEYHLGWVPFDQLTGDVVNTEGIDLEYVLHGQQCHLGLSVGGCSASCGYNKKLGLVLTLALSLSFYIRVFSTFGVLRSIWP